MAESTARKAELRRERVLTTWILVLFLLTFLSVFKPVRRVATDSFYPVYYSYRYEKPFGSDDQAKRKVEQALREKLIEASAIADARITFPSETEIKIRAMLGSKEDVGPTGETLQTMVEESVPERFGKLVSAAEPDASDFGAPPLATFGGFGLYKPALHMRLGLDLQGGVHLVLQARTQNVQIEYELGDDAAKLTEALDQADAADTGAAPAPAATEAAAEAEKPAAAAEAEKPTDAEPEGAEGDKPADATGDGDDEVTTEAEAKLLSDADLRERVAARVAKLTAAVTTQYGERIGEVHGETVGSTIAVFRTYVDPKDPEADQKRAQHASLLLAELRKVFPQATQKGDAQALDIPDNAIQQVQNVIARRVDRLGVSEAEVSTHGRDRVVVQLPGLRDPEEAVAMIGTTARLEFRKVPEKYVPESEETEGREITRFYTKDTHDLVETDQVYYEAPEFVTEDPRRSDKNIMTGSDLKAGSIQVTFDQDGQPAVSLVLNNEGSKRFDQFAAESYQKFLAVYLDREVISAPVMNARHFNGQVLISGGFKDVKEATDLKTLLDAGALPVPVDVVEQRAVSAKLGADSVRQSLQAGVAGLLLIVLSMALLYRGPGLLANVALSGYLLLVLAVFGMIDATLTLPGIMGVILGIGMAVDANVIIFERLKEELRESENRPLPQCIRLSYERAAAAIWDGNITTLLIAFVLMMFGTGPIKGFAVTLTISIVCSLFTALVVTRRFQNLFAATRFGADRRMYRR